MWESCESNGEPKETMMPQPERREALPTIRCLWVRRTEAMASAVDGLVVQPLALSISEVDALGAQTHTADSGL